MPTPGIPIHPATAQLIKIVEGEGISKNHPPRVIFSDSKNYICAYRI
jgi:hypothetical protein